MNKIIFNNKVLVNFNEKDLRACITTSLIEFSLSLLRSVYQFLRMESQPLQEKVYGRLRDVSRKAARVRRDVRHGCNTVECRVDPR